jgi:choline dehydrogenase-like flavoprotein
MTASTSSTVAIVGAGIAGTTIAYLLAQQGVDVAVFEKGPDYPYPHTPQFQEEVINRYTGTLRDLPRGLRQIEQTGDLPFQVDDERYMRVGGMATIWGAITLRMQPADFQTRTLFGRGEDWPITYDTLEPYYSRAEALLGVSGSDTDNPFAPPRSQPFPLPPFDLSYTDTLLADRLRAGGIHLHTTPQARTRLPYESRPGCQNYGTCWVCPLGVRYAPNYHLQQAVAGGRCTLRSGVAVRRVVVDASGQARALLLRDLATGDEWEHSARVIVLAAGAVETIRLLLLSADDRHPDGLGNAGGQVGRRLGYHQIRHALLRYPQPVYPGRVGAPTGESHQFINHDQRGTYGGVKIEFTETAPRPGIADATFDALDDMAAASEFFTRTRWLWLHAESDMTERKYAALGSALDPLGDRVPAVHHEASAFDRATYDFARQLTGRMADASGAESWWMEPFETWTSWSHHMGGCRMGHSPDSGAVDPFGQVHGVPNLFTAGASSFVETSPVNPTLTLVALAIRTADYLRDQRLAGG